MGFLWPHRHLSLMEAAFGVARKAMGSRNNEANESYTWVHVGNVAEAASCGWRGRVDYHPWLFLQGKKTKVFLSHAQQVAVWLGISRRTRNLPDAKLLWVGQREEGPPVLEARSVQLENRANMSTCPSPVNSKFYEDCKQFHGDWFTKKWTKYICMYNVNVVYPIYVCACTYLHSHCLWDTVLSVSTLRMELLCEKGPCLLGSLLKLQGI